MRIDFPQGWQSQTPGVSHWQMLCWMTSAEAGVSGSRLGLMWSLSGACAQGSQRRRYRSVRAFGPGCLVVQF